MNPSSHGVDGGFHGATGLCEALRLCEAPLMCEALRGDLAYFSSAVSCRERHRAGRVASIYGGPDGLCGSRTASGERLNCAAMTAAHRTLPFGTLVEVCHDGCVTVRINDRGPFVRGRHIDLSPAAARAIGLRQTGHVTMSHR